MQRQNNQEQTKKKTVKKHFEGKGLLTRVQKIRIYPNKEFQKTFDEYFKYNIYCYNRALDVSRAMFHEWKHYKGTDKKEHKKLWPSSKSLRDKMKANRKGWELGFNQSIIENQAGNAEQAWKNYANPNMNNSYPKKKDVAKELQSKHKSVVFALSANVEGYFTHNENGKPMLKVPSVKSKEALKFPLVRMAETIRYKKANKARALTIVKSNDEWYAIVTFRGLSPNIVNKKEKVSTAVDLNVKHFDYLNEKGQFEQFLLMGKNLESQLVKVKNLSRQLSKKRNEFAKIHGKKKKYIESNNYKETKRLLNKAYTKAVNITEDSLYKFIKYLTNNFSKITIEDLNVAGMKMNKRLSKSLHRAGFGKFRTLLEQKAIEKSVELVIADRFYPSTQRCSKCGFVKTGEDKLGLSGDKHGNKHHEYKCFNCGEEFERDENAVQNLIDFSNELMEDIKKTFYSKNKSESIAHNTAKKEKRREKQRTRRKRIKEQAEVVASDK